MTDSANTTVAPADDEFDRLQALYDALYNLLTPEQRTTFFSGLVPPREPKKGVASDAPTLEGAAMAEAVGHALFAIADDMGKVGRLLRAIELAAAGLQTRDEAEALVELAVSTWDLWHEVKEARTAAWRLTLSDVPTEPAA